MSEKNAVNGKNIQPSDEEIIAYLSDWLTNSLFTHTNKKIAVGKLLRRYIQSKLTIGRIRGIIKKQQKDIEDLKEKLIDFIEEQKRENEMLRNLLYTIRNITKGALIVNTNGFLDQ